MSDLLFWNLISQKSLHIIKSNSWKSAHPGLIFNTHLPRHIDALGSNLSEMPSLEGAQLTKPKSQVWSPVVLARWSHYNVSVFMIAYLLKIHY